MLKSLLNRLSSTVLLVLMLASVYAPFLGSRFIRTAGDEKVYVSQAIEMERAGHWFIQTLQDEPNYHKGPIHYILLRVGMKVFGRTPWAVLYMNFALLIAGALALAALVRRRLAEWAANSGGDVWIGAAFAFGVGIYAHAFATQMEIELASLFSIALFLLDRTRREDAGWAFWIVAGLVGLVKSPLHSAFLGTSALLYWTLSGEIWVRMKNPRSWVALSLGIATCIGGFLPAYLMDRENFWNAYVIRETLRKSDGSGQGWSVAVLSTYGFYLFPWLLLALVSYAQTIARAPSLLKDAKTRNTLALAFSMLLPSTAFFCWHVYRFENYNLPVICGVWLWVATLWCVGRDLPGWRTAYLSAIRVTAVLFFILPIALTILAVHFSPLPGWWPAWLLPAVWIGSLVSAAGFFLYEDPKRLALCSCGYLWAFGALFAVIGEREMIDLRHYIADRGSSDSRAVQLGYYNVNRNIWSEWGLLNFWVDHEVHGLHTPEMLQAAIARHETILVSAKEDGIRDFHDFAAKNFPGAHFREIPWKRWRTRGQSDSGKPRWQEAWEKRDLSLLEIDYLIVETAHAAQTAAPGAKN